MKIFVTGGNGFIGSHLAAKLLARGDEVICLVRDPARVEAARNPRLQGVRLVKGDITQRAGLREPMQGADAVFHVAGMYEYGPKYIPQMRAVNVDGTRNVLEIAAELGVPHIIHTSSVGVFGNTHGLVVDESYRCKEDDLSSEYERTKWEAHYQVAVPLQQKGAPVILAMPGGVMGPDDPSPHTAMYDFYFNRFPIGMGAKSGFCVAHVDDTAYGHIQVLERGRNGETYIIAGMPITWKQATKEWAKITGIPAPRLWAPKWIVGANRMVVEGLERVGLHLPVASESLTSLMDYTYWGSSDKARRELGWQPRPPAQVFSDVMNHQMLIRGITPE